MRLQRLLLSGVAVVAAASLAAQAGAGSRAAVRVSGTYTVDAKAKVKDACRPISRANPAVLRCTSSGFTLVYSGTLQGRGVHNFKSITNCATGKFYTHGSERFTGTIAGVGSGTATFGVRVTGTIDCKKGALTNVSAVEDLHSGTGAFAGLYGTFHRGPKTYSGVLSS